MVTFGRRASTRVGIPNNRGMAARANRQLEGIAVAKAEQFTTSLGVDAPLFYFWKDSGGSMPCTCSAARRGPNVDIDPGGPTRFVASSVKDTGQQDFDMIDTGDYGDSSIDDLLGPQARGRRATSKEKLTNENFDDMDDIEDVDSMSGVGITDFEDPLNLFNAKVIDCSICLGSGYIDAWNPYGGKRYVFDTTNAYDFDCTGIDVEDGNPNRMVSGKNARAYWQFKLPMAWNDIVRLNVYNGTDIIAPHLYRWVYEDASAVIQVLTPQALEQLNGTGQILKLAISFTEQDVVFTHAEIIFMFSEPMRAQIPEIEQGYEQEFLDWNVNLTVELPPSLDISEGDYLTESKYKKVWKVSTLTRKVTEGGVTYGLSANLRALHSFEKDFLQMALFRTNFLTGNLVK